MRTIKTIFWLIIIAGVTAMYGFLFLPFFTHSQVAGWAITAGVVVSLTLVAAFGISVLFAIFCDWLEAVEDQIEEEEEPYEYNPKTPEQTKQPEQINIPEMKFGYGIGVAINFQNTET